MQVHAKKNPPQTGGMYLLFMIQMYHNQQNIDNVTLHEDISCEFDRNMFSETSTVNFMISRQHTGRNPSLIHLAETQTSSPTVPSTDCDAMQPQFCCLSPSYLTNQTQLTTTFLSFSLTFLKWKNPTALSRQITMPNKVI